MAFIKNNSRSQAHQSGNTSEDKVDKILETLPELNKLLSDALEKNKGVTDRYNNKIHTIARSVSAPPAPTRVAFDGKLIKSLQYQFQLLKLKLGKLEQFQSNVGLKLDKHLVTLQSLVTNLDSSRVFSQATYQIKPDLEEIEKKISDLLYQVPLLSAKSEKQKATAYGDQDDEDDEVHQDKAYYYLPAIHTNVEGLIKCEAFRHVKQMFMELDNERKILLLSFAVFPENREVHRTVLMYCLEPHWRRKRKFAVEVLRLTSLPELRVGWIELKQIHFPKLTFLEKYECPRVSLTPCDGNGIWRSDQDD
uniref:Uncharacterized protein n=1 Tax=Noccaea caerulescens TaxID=107243 RepID=A0A1J3CCE7_NOCCA